MTKSLRKTQKAQEGEVIRFMDNPTEYVVERTAWEGGAEGEGMSGHESWPDGHHVSARRLKKDGTYDPNGKVVMFYQSGCFDNVRKWVEVVGHMKKMYLRV